jgi:Protein of unknown function (DUF4054)
MPYSYATLINDPQFAMLITPDPARQNLIDRFIFQAERRLPPDTWDLEHELGTYYLALHNLDLFDRASGGGTGSGNSFNGQITSLSVSQDSRSVSYKGVDANDRGTFDALLATTRWGLLFLALRATIPITGILY